MGMTVFARQVTAKGTNSTVLTIGIGSVFCIVGRPRFTRVALQQPAWRFSCRHALSDVIALLSSCGEAG